VHVMSHACLSNVKVLSTHVDNEGRQNVKLAQNCLTKDSFFIGVTFSSCTLSFKIHDLGTSSEKAPKIRSVLYGLLVHTAYTILETVVHNWFYLAITVDRYKV
jgi:hypothetical protein